MIEFERLIAVDPQTNGFGLAIFHDGDLVAGEFAKGLDQGRFFDRYSRISKNTKGIIHARRSTGKALILYEMPQIYKTGRSKGDPNGLVRMAAIASAACAVVAVGEGDAVVDYVLPSTWKGQVPKEIMQDRIMTRLSDFERGAILAKGTALGHVIDAIGLGLWKLRRL